VAGDRVVNFILRGHDEASSVFKGVYVDAVGAIRGVIDVAQELAHAFEGTLEAAREQDTADKMLAAGLANVKGATSETFKSLQRFASQIQATTGVADDQAEHMMQLFASFGNNETAIRAATVAALDYAAATGITAANAATALSNAAHGNTTALRRHGVIIDAATAKAKGLAWVSEQVEAKFRGMAAAAMDTVGGGLTAIHNSFSDLQEARSGRASRSAQPRPASSRCSRPEGGHRVEPHPQPRPAGGAYRGQRGPELAKQDKQTLKVGEDLGGYLGRGMKAALAGDAQSIISMGVSIIAKLMGTFGGPVGGILGAILGGIFHEGSGDVGHRLTYAHEGLTRGPDEFDVIRMRRPEAILTQRGVASAGGRDAVERMNRGYSMGGGEVVVQAVHVQIDGSRIDHRDFRVRQVGEDMRRAINYGASEWARKQRAAGLALGR
jgi:hypothetical protein